MGARFRFQSVLASSPEPDTDGKPSSTDQPRIFISAAEPSGDLHAAELIRAIRGRYPRAALWGVAGTRMRAAGCEAIDDLTDRSAMLLGAVGLAGHALRLLGHVKRRLQREGADLAILVDSPTLHLPMAKKVKSAGCPVLYYIAPQLWAWAPGRIRRVRRRVDRMAVILPFEEEYFRTRGVDARFVGHPLVEQLRERSPAPSRVEAFRAAGKPVIACLPGSRRHVVSEVLPGQIEVCRAIAARHPQATFLFAAASEAAARTAAGRIKAESFPCQIAVGHNAEILAAADLALCASGTATLEVAWHGVPMVVMYNGSKWGYRMVGRFLIQTPHLSLVNILAGRRIVPEFMPYYTSTEPIAAEALDLLENDARREQVRSDLRAVIASLGAASASHGAADIVEEMLAAARNPNHAPRQSPQL